MLAIELADVSAALQTGKRKVRKGWSDRTKKVVRDWFAEHGLDNKKPGSLTNAQRHKRHRHKLKASARRGAMEQHEGVARLKDELADIQRKTRAAFGNMNYSPPLGLILMSMLKPEVSPLVVRLLVELVEGRDRDGWNPETSAEFARLCAERGKRAKEEVAEERIPKVDHRALGR